MVYDESVVDVARYRTADAIVDARSKALDERVRLATETDVDDGLSFTVKVAVRGLPV